MLKKIFYFFALLGPLLSENFYAPTLFNIKIPTIFYLTIFLFYFLFGNKEYTYQLLTKNIVAKFMLAYLFILIINNAFIVGKLFWRMDEYSNVLWLSTLKRVLFVVLIFWVFDKPKEVIKLFMFYLGGIFLSALAAYLQMLVLHHGIFSSSDISSNEGYLRATGFYDNPNEFGFSIVVLLSISIYQYIKTKNRYFLLLGLFLLYPLFASYSRDAWLAMAITIFSMIFILGKNFDKKKIILLLIVFCCLISLIILNVPVLKDRLLLTFQGGDNSLAARFITIYFAFFAWLKAPLWGIGAYQSAILFPGNITIHNFYLHSLFETGIIGFIITSLFLFYVIQQYYKFHKSNIMKKYERDFSSIAVIILISYYSFIFLGNHIQNEIFWILIAIQLVIYKNTRLILNRRQV